jgi:hypothetical protein
VLGVRASQPEDHALSRAMTKSKPLRIRRCLSEYSEPPRLCRPHDFEAMELKSLV